MEKAKINRYIKMHVIHKTLPQYKIDFTQNFDSKFRPLLQTKVSEEKFIEIQYGFYPYWEDRIDDQCILEYRQKYDKPIELIEVDDTVDDLHVSDTLRHALRDSWTVNP